MARADITYHSVTKSLDKLGNIYPPQDGNAVILELSARPVHGETRANVSLARVVVDANCRVAVGVNIDADAVNSRLLLAGMVETVQIPAGQRLSMIGA